MNRMDPELPKRGPECPAPAVLEAFSAGEDPGETAKRHIDACPNCAPYVAALRGGSEAFLRARPPEQFLRKLDRRAEATRKRRRWWLALLPTAALAALVLVLLPIVDGTNGGGVLVKGDPFKVVFRRGEASPQVVSADARLRPGDALRFSYDAPSDGYLLILNLDGTGQASVFYPPEGTRSAPIARGATDFLPGSIVLDEAPGPEWLVAVFSQKPLEAALLLARLKEQAGTAQPKLVCDGCRVSTLRLQKQLP